MINNEKYINLINVLKKMDKVMIAFSGGVDSTFLLQAAKEALGDRLKAVTIQSPYIPEWEINEAKQFVLELGIEHQIIEVPIIDGIKKNPADRCYLCKKAIFSEIKAIAKEQGFHYVIDGTNYDDLDDYRPGLKALKELNIKSPLMECKLTKNDIRDYSKQLGLNTWNKPAYACLLTRIPYGEDLKEEELKKIESAEKYLIDNWIREVRVRCHGNLARIEVSKNDIWSLLNEDILKEISIKLKQFGFQYVTLDLEGYRIGSFNEMIKNE